MNVSFSYHLYTKCHLKRWHLARKEALYELKDLLFQFIDYPFYLTYRQVKFFCQRLKADTVYQPPLHDRSVSLAVYMLFDKTLDIAVRILCHFNLILPVPWHMLHFLYPDFPPVFLRLTLRIVCFAIFISPYITVCRVFVFVFWVAYTKYCACRYTCFSHDFVYTSPFFYELTIFC